MWFNENDAYPAQWLRNLWPEAVVDERSIDTLTPSDVPAGRCHFFAGIGGWEYALELAGWPRDREVWTGSCPCQPFSAAGKRQGAEDERHLWPAWFRLIAQRRPATIFGEQVASRLGREWLAGVRADLESLGYAVGAADLCAASAGAPHIRQRLWWVAYARVERRQQKPRGTPGDEIPNGRWPERNHLVTGNGGRGGLADAGRASVQRLGKPGETRGTTGAAQGEAQQRERGWDDAGGCGGLGHADDDRRRGGGQSQPGGIEGARREQPDGPIDRAATAAGGVAYAEGDGREQGRAESIGRKPTDEQRREAGRGDAAGWLTEPVWSSAEWRLCADGKARRIEPGIRPLAHGVPARVGQLSAYGNSITPQVAAIFVRAFMETED